MNSEKDSNDSPDYNFRSKWRANRTEYAKRQQIAKGNNIIAEVLINCYLHSVSYINIQHI